MRAAWAQNRLSHPSVHRKMWHAWCEIVNCSQKTCKCHFFLTLLHLILLPRIGGCSFTRKYPGERIVHSEPSRDPLDEDMLVLKWMRKNSIGVVRGGSWSNLTLNKNQIEQIEMQLNHAAGKCIKCFRYGHFASECPNRGGTSPVGPAAAAAAAVAVPPPPPSPSYPPLPLPPRTQSHLPLLQDPDDVIITSVLPPSSASHALPATASQPTAGHPPFQASQEHHSTSEPSQPSSSAPRVASSWQDQIADTRRSLAARWRASDQAARRRREEPSDARQQHLLQPQQQQVQDMLQQQQQGWRMILPDGGWSAAAQLQREEDTAVAFRCRKVQAACSQCGRRSHRNPDCYARFDIQGRYIYRDESSSGTESDSDNSISGSDETD